MRYLYVSSENPNGIEYFKKRFQGKKVSEIIDDLFQNLDVKSVVEIKEPDYDFKMQYMKYNWLMSLIMPLIKKFTNYNGLKEQIYKENIQL